jgi:hypothetical protein
MGKPGWIKFSIIQKSCRAGAPETRIGGKLETLWQTQSERPTGKGAYYRFVPVLSITLLLP